MTGPYTYASALCGEYPTPDRIHRRLGLGEPACMDPYDVSSVGTYRLCCRGRVVRSTDGHAVVPKWMLALVLASLIHPDPPQELLAAATILLVEGHVQVDVQVVT